MLKTIRGIKVLSLGKMAGIIYACLGLLVGTIIAMVSVLGGFAGMAHEGGAAAGFLGMFLGVGAVIICPIFYGLLGTLVGIVVASIFNVAARLVGGVEVEID